MALARAAGDHRLAGRRPGGQAAAGGGPIGSGARISGAANAEARPRADVVIVAVPWDGHRDLLASLAGPLAGKIVIDCVNPMGFDNRGAYPLPVPEGSAAQQAAAVLPDSTVVGAFHHVSAVVLLDPEVAELTWTCWCSATTGRPPTWCRRWPACCPASAGSTRAGCATAARSRR